MNEQQVNGYCVHCGEYDVLRAMRAWCAMYACGLCGVCLVYM